MDTTDEKLPQPNHRELSRRIWEAASALTRDTIFDATQVILAEVYTAGVDPCWLRDEIDRVLSWKRGMSYET